MFGDRLKRSRETAGFSQEKLASLVDVSRKTIIRWERGERAPSMDKIALLSSALNVSTAYLMGETDEPGSHAQKKPGTAVPDLKNNIVSDKGKIAVPVLDINTAASAGCGNGLCGVTPEASEYILVDPDDIGPIDDRHRPFCIRVEGDSMEGAGIPDGSMVVINPAIEVSNGAIALVVFDDLWMVKGIVRQRDGSVELRSSNPNYAPVVVEPEMATDDSWLKVIGPVMEVVIRRKPGRVI